VSRLCPQARHEIASRPCPVSAIAVLRNHTSNLTRENAAVRCQDGRWAPPGRQAGVDPNRAPRALTAFLSEATAPERLDVSIGEVFDRLYGWPVRGTCLREGAGVQRRPVRGNSA
jgi:hypothetical protein